MGKRFTVFALITLALFYCADSYATYSSAFRFNTKNGRIFNFETWDAKLIWHVTFFSDEFRRAYDEKYIKVNHLDDADADAYTKESEYGQSRGWDFFVCFYTKKDYKKFTNEPDSFWKVHLTTGNGEVVKPESVEMIPITPFELVMYKHLNRWSKAYRIRFPKVDLGDEFSLAIQSVVGESTLKWRAK